MISRKKIIEILKHPNSLTLYRVAAIPLIVILLHFSTSFANFTNRIITFVAAILFSAAAITDFLDGFYARKMGLVSNLGKMLDPLADKLLISSSFIMLAANGWVSAWIVCVIIGREIAVTGLRSLIAENKMDMSASMLGKYKTGFQIAAIIPLLIHYPYFGVRVEIIGKFFLWGALIFSVWSGVDYFIRFRRLLKS